ncbi:MAG: hypothetical protein JSR82_04825 [Verrucomicrobia bacterium]|nr:hypothetical protein [Verrucomicrobiota bacterium]
MADLPWPTLLFLAGAGLLNLGLALAILRAARRERRALRGPDGDRLELYRGAELSLLRPWFILPAAAGLLLLHQLPLPAEPTLTWRGALVCAALGAALTLPSLLGLRLAAAEWIRLLRRLEFLLGLGVLALLRSLVPIPALGAAIFLFAHAGALLAARGWLRDQLTRFAPPPVRFGEALFAQPHIRVPRGLPPD